MFFPPTNFPNLIRTPPVYSVYRRKSMVKCEKGISVVIIFLCIYTIHQQITFLGPGITYPNPLLTQFAGGYGRGVVSTYPQETIYTAIRGGGGGGNYKWD